MPKTVYYRLQFGPFGRSYWAAFHFLTIFVPRILSRVSSYPKTVYYRLQFGQFGKSYWVMFHFLTSFVPRVLGHVSSTIPLILKD
ncbi:hypothetical protein KSS87_009843 [Heliosperma pusillum]|nr:hypothetical protein KSS87_009843 [Heliosperma pusillum]